MRMIIFPFTLIYVSICIISFTSTFNLAVVEVTNIFRLVGPKHDALALQLVVSEVSGIYLARVSIVVPSFSMKFAVDELTVISGAIEIEPARTCLLSPEKVTSVYDSAEVPLLDSVTVLYIVLPLT